MGGVRRNCWTCGHDDEGDCFILETQADGWPECEAWVETTDWVARYPPTDADGCPGWKPKPGAYIGGLVPREDAVSLAPAEVYSTAAAYQAAGRTMRREDGNTDRAQVAALRDGIDGTSWDVPAMWRPEPFDSATIRPDSATGWRGNLPTCRGPGGIAARRMRRAGIAVRGVL